MEYVNCPLDIAEMAPGVPSSTEASDTLSCRMYHLGLAQKSPDAATIHCPHASSRGGDVCVNPPPPPPSQFCANYQTTCSGVSPARSNQYVDCATSTAAMAPGVPGSNAAGNTLSCREYHLGIAMSSSDAAQIHCPHASLSGGGVCVDASPPSMAPASGEVDLGNGISLTFMPSATDVTLTITYQGTSWLGFGVSRGGMVGSKMIIGSSMSNSLTALKYSASAYAKPSVDATQDFVGMTFTQTDGVSTLSFSAPLTWLEQLSSDGSPQVTVVAAHGNGNTLAYHGATKKVTTIKSFRAPTQTSFCSDYIATCANVGPNAPPYSDCASTIETFRSGTPGSSEAGDTLSCREYHLGIAMTSPDSVPIHCPHASPTGGGVCVNPPPPPPVDFCAVYSTTCATPGFADKYPDCASSFADFSPGTTNSQASGDTRSCRLYHLSLAVQSTSNAQIHCPHASLSGGGVCVNASPPPALGVSLSFPASTLAGYDYQTQPDGAPYDYTLHWKLRGSEVDMAVVAFVPSNPSSWVGVGFSPDFSMIGTSAVLGEAATCQDAAQTSCGTVEMWHLDAKPPSFGTSKEPLTNTQISVVDGKVTIKFTRTLTGRVPLTANGATPLLWAIGNGPYGPGSKGYHGSNKGRFAISLSGDAGAASSGSLGLDPVSVYKLVHGVLMWLAWGLLLPLGAITSRFFRQHNPLWFDLHRLFQITGLVGALVGFIIALNHFTPFTAMVDKLGRAHYVFGVPMRQRPKHVAPEAWRELSVPWSWHACDSCAICV